jgi:hypothetical protein
MKKHSIQAKAKPTEADVLADLLAHGSPTQEHIDPATGRVPEGLYEGSGHDRMVSDSISRANHNDGDDKSSTPKK